MVAAVSSLEFAQDAVLSIVINHPQTAARVFGVVPVEAFDGPRSHIAQAIQGLRLKREPITMETIAIEMGRRGTLARAGGVPEIHRLQMGYSILEALDTYLDEVVRHVRLTKLEAIGTRAVQYTGATDADPLEIAELIRQQAQAILDAGEADADVDTLTLDEFLAIEDAEYDWVIPGLLERADRLILTGSEGLGKSTLFRQLAVMTAAGLHPFTGRTIPQQRVLYVDCENGPTHMRRKLRPLAIQAKRQGPGAGQTLFIEGRPEGLNLLDPAGQQWLVARVAALQPAVLFTGSLYKLFEGDPNKEEPARAVAAVLDRCRAVSNCAIVIEAHSGHGTTAAGERHVRPVGASLWLRWPEFGYGLRATKDFDPATRVVEFTAWRGDRDERAWPKRLKAGSTWPWVEAAYDAYNDLEAVS